MKNYVILASALLLSVGGFAQKDQIKSAEKALKSGNANEANNQLKQAEALLGNATDQEKAQYYLVKGNTMRDFANKKIDIAKNLAGAAEAYQQVLAIEKNSGKIKFSPDAKSALDTAKNDLINAAVDAGGKKDYKTASELLHSVYEIDKTDMEKLYYAASYAVNGQDYDTALTYYDELKKANFSGEGTGYYAKNAISGQEDFFGATPAAKTDRETKMKLKLYTDPRDEKIPSKKGEIYKNIALIYVQKGKTDEAKKALEEARAANPDDNSLAMAQADLFLQLKDFDSYKKVTNEILQKNPDANILYNLGVVSSKTDPAAAEMYYKKAIDLDPKYTNAYLNLSIMKLDKDKAIIEEMNKLGTSEKDNKRYEALKKQRTELFTSVLPYLEKAYELDPKNADVGTTLLNVYGALDMTDKKKELKAKLGK